MSSPLFGHTRTHIGARHALITPDGHVPSTMPGAEGVRIFYHISPAMGAAFAQSTLQFDAGGFLRWPLDENIERFLYVAQGDLALRHRGREEELITGSFAFCPPEAAMELSAESTATVIVFEKPYKFTGGVPAPEAIVGSADDVPGQPFLGNPKARLQVLLPESRAFDMAVNIFTYEPGATLPFVETHIMEHGLLMLRGQGIYRLEERWYPVTAGDVIWMAPFCPQWFVAMGDEPASYLYYKDVNRPGLGGSH